MRKYCVTLILFRKTHKLSFQVATLVAFLSFSLISQAQIAFVSGRDWNPEIYVMDADGNNLRNLTNHPASDGLPSWSPDGQKIAFVSDRDGFKDSEIFTMNADGSNLHRLTDNIASDSFPSWSPDGQRIAFVSDRDGFKNTDIYVIDVDGDNLRDLTDNPALDEFPSWSPDGQSIAFASNRDGNMEIYVMDADGGNLRRLTNNPGSDESPSWSPDGQRIAFVVSSKDGGEKPPDDGGKDVKGGDSEIYVMDADGDNQLNLTNNPALDDSPSYTPDGQSIVFHSDRDGNLEIYVMDADGSNPRNLTNHPAPDSQPDWLNPSGHPVTPSGATAGKFRITWGWLKQNSE